METPFNEALRRRQSDAEQVAKISRRQRIRNDDPNGKTLNAVI